MDDIDLSSGARSERPQRVRDALATLDGQLVAGQAHELRIVATGFETFDRVVGGGLHSGALTVIGGAPGVGKTTLALQWARNIARDGHDVVYACYGHASTELLVRLVCQELTAFPPEVAAEVRGAITSTALTGGTGLIDVLDANHVTDAVLDRIATYAARLHVVQTAGRAGLRELDGYLTDLSGAHPVLVVDHLQRIHVGGDSTQGAEQARRAAQGLKDLALAHMIPVLAVVSADRGGAGRGPTRMHDFRGSSAIAVEADLAVLVNDKRDAVTQAGLSSGTARVEGLHDRVVLSVEKNRHGPTNVDMEFRTDFPRCRFDPDGALRTEKLVARHLTDA